MPNYLVLIKLKTTTRERMAETLPALNAILKRISNNQFKLAFRSTATDIITFFVKSDMKAKQIVNIIQAPDSDRAAREFNVAGSPIFSGEAVYALEMGEDFAGVNETDIGSWLQKNR